MATSTLIRWSGLALIVGGISLALFVLSHPQVEFGPDATRQPTWVLSHSFHAVGALLALFGLIGVFVRQRDEAGALGLLAFIVAFIGTALLVATGLISAYILPGAPSLLVGAEPTLDAIPFVLQTVFMIVGYILLAAAIVRSGVLPRWAALAMVVGVVLFDLPPFVVPLIVLTLGGVVFGASLAWVGYALWSRGAVEAVTPARA